jgi:hypothetical protein
VEQPIGSTESGGGVSTVLQIIGALLIAGGLAMLYPWLGVTALGILLVVAGVALEVEERDGSRQSE